jgi:hypothetical protein
MRQVCTFRELNSPAPGTEDHNGARILSFLPSIAKAPAEDTDSAYLD